MLTQQERGCSDERNSVFSDNPTLRSMMMRRRPILKRYVDPVGSLLFMMMTTYHFQSLFQLMYPPYLATFLLAFVVLWVATMKHTWQCRLVGSSAAAFLLSMPLCLNYHPFMIYSIGLMTLLVSSVLDFICNKKRSYMLVFCALRAILLIALLMFLVNLTKSQENLALGIRISSGHHITKAWSAVTFSAIGTFFLLYDTIRWGILRFVKERVAS